VSILDTPEDFKLCDQLWCALSENPIDVPSFSSARDVDTD
jgi:hypothetical protein